MTDQPIILEPATAVAKAPTHAVIWLHGLGADGNDFVPIVPYLGLPADAAVRFIFPHAPHQPVTCNGGYVMRAWYDIISLEPHSREVDLAGLQASRATLRALIAEQNAAGIPCEHIFLAGFSQGGAVAYTTALTHPEPLAGVLALSTYLPTIPLLDAEGCTAPRNTPFFCAHGTHDDVVSLALGEQARDYLQAQGYQPEWHTWAMGHEVNLDEIRAIGAWLSQRLK